MASTKKFSSTAKDVKKAKDALSKASSPPHDAVRETIESVVIAFVLAFLFRTFEAEAFVIPTGSMAPTLLGQNKDVECEACNFSYNVSASHEDKGVIVRSSACPNCGYRMAVEDKPTYSGDRLLVSKFSYELEDPERWDVIVFKFPGRAKNNYIKRLIGLPNETVVIKHGDIFTGPNPLPPEGKLQIQRKPPDKVRAVLQTVYDNDYVLTDWIKAGWPACWAPSGDKTEGNWTAGDDHRSFSVHPKDGQQSWLRYRNIAISSEIWREIWRDFQANGSFTEADLQLAHPRGVLDNYAYNNGLPQYGSSSLPNWVGDLAIECVLTADEKQGDVTLQLVKGGRRFECRFNLTDGSAQLSIPGLESFEPKAQNVFSAGKTHRVMFANVDEQLFLWVDDSVVEFDSPTYYDDLNNYIETPEDGSPVGIGVQGASARVAHLRVLRDIFYINAGRGTGPMPLEDDQFLMLGDNSPQSSDSRLWLSLDTDGRPITDANGNEIYYVRRDLLIGKAIYIYWPHAWAPDWAVPIRIYGFQLYLPFYPNFGRMKLVR